MDDKAAIEAAIREFIEAYNRGDLAGVLQCYGNDLIKLRQGAPAETKPETARRIAEAFERNACRVEVVTDEVRTSGDLAIVRGNFRVSLVPKAGGEAQRMERRYLEIWRKEGGRWLVVRTMDNSA